MVGPKSARGFTLVELLVVIAIIGILVSLLLPAIQAAREAGRRNTCQSNMHNAALALLNFEQSKRGLPGYAVPIPKAGTPVPYRASWVVPILPYLERNDLYQNWINPTYNLVSPVGTTRQGLVSPLHVLLCPSNPSPDLGDNPLHFVVNSGSAISADDNSTLSPYNYSVVKVKFHGQNWPEDLSSGVFFNHAQIDYKLPTKKVSLDYVSANDGTASTLMMTENLQAGTWGLSSVSQTAFESEFEIRQNVGFVWFVTGNAENAIPPNVSTFGGKYDFAALGINDRAKDVTGAPSGIYNAAASTPTGLAFARPSAGHPGGVNAAFCDGHMRFLNDEMDYKVYTQLMTSFHDSVIIDWQPNVDTGIALRANKIGPGTTAGITKVTYPWTYALRDSDF